MSSYRDQLDIILAKRKEASLRIYTLGRFHVQRDNEDILPKSWGRDKTIQLFQFLITARHRHSLHKEQIIDRIWPDAASNEGDRNFKVALHGINKVLEPYRKPRTDPKYILRQGVTYSLVTSEIWIDTQMVEDCIALAHESWKLEPETAIKAFRLALELHNGVYLPDRMFEDWSSEERERLQVLILNAYVSLAELLLNEQAMETIRLTQRALIIDDTWEDAYQLQMRAYIKNGNRPAAIKTYNKCVRIMDEEFGLDPLPQTQKIYDEMLI